MSRREEPAPGSIPAIVLAGGEAPPGEEWGASHRALAPIHGWPMLRWVLRALGECPSIGPRILVAPATFPREPEAEVQIPAEGDIAGNLLAGARACGDAPFALVATADLPFLTPEAVEDYLRRCLAAPADCMYAAIRVEACRKRFPGSPLGERRTALATPDGAYTGGNVVLQRLAAVERELELLRRAYRARKNPLFLARIIGGRNLLRFLMRRLTLADIETAASRLLGVRCRLVETPYAELGADVDRPEHLRAARALLPPPGTATAG